MGKKKKSKQPEKLTTVNNIEQLNLEIDYDKLADAIVKATKQEDEKHSISREWMKFVITPIFWLLAITSGIIAIGFFAETIVNINALNENTFVWARWLTIILCFSLSMFLLCVCVLTIATVKEIEKENNKQYVATMFSNIVALVALIVALIALFKGVG